MIYLVSGQVTISITTLVEADSPEEAKEIAADRQMQMVDDVGRHGQTPEEVWCHSGELDGEAQINRVEEYEE
jgi:hypothetical protein